MSNTTHTTAQTAQETVKRAEERFERAKKGTDDLEVLRAGRDVIKSLRMKYQ